jgi:hypothetical protein
MPTETKIEKRRLRLIDLMRTPEFQTLSEKQGIFVARYVSSGFLTGRYDASDAAKTAYRTKNPEVLGAELLGQKKIKRILDLHFGRTPMDSILADLEKAVKKSLRRGSKSRPSTITPETARALQLFEQYVAAKENSNA